MNPTKSNKLWNILSILIQLLLAGTAGAFLYYLCKLQLLPKRYTLLVCGAVALLVLLTLVLMRRAKTEQWQKTPGRFRQIIGTVLACVLIVGCCAGTYVLDTLSDTLSSITNTGSTVQVLLEVYVRADDPAQHIHEAGSYLFAVSETTDEADNLAAVADLEAMLGSTITTVRYPSTLAMIDALYAGDVGAIILDSSYLSILDSQEGYTDFDSKVRLLREYIIEKDPAGENSGTPNQNLTLKDTSVTPFLVYISGNDARRLLLADGGSDVNILVAVNPVEHQILMVNTPRDYYVVNPASGNGSRDKLSHCGLKGIDNCIQAVSGLYGVPIDYYARINFTGFQTLIDAIGGVTVNVETPFSTGDCYFHQGENRLNGYQALTFARDRKNQAGGDNDRGKNQMRLIEGMIRELSSGTLLTNYSEILESLEGMFTTSMSVAEIAKLVQFQLSEMPNWEIYTFAVTGDNGNDLCWAAGGNGYVMYPHQHMVDKAISLMETVLSGEPITQADLTVE